MIYIVHGNDLAKSRSLLINQQKKLGIETKIELDILETTPDKLMEICSSGDLFGSFPFVIFDITNAGRKKVDEYVEVLKKIPDQTSVVILSNKSLSKSNAFIKAATTLKARTIANEKTPQGNVFKFVDSLFTKNRSITYKNLANLLSEGQDPFYMLSMVTYGLRNIATAKFNSPLYKKMSPFVKSKAEKQSQRYSETTITELYKELYTLDRKVKTGEMTPEMTLTKATEKVLNSL